MQRLWLDEEGLILIPSQTEEISDVVHPMSVPKKFEHVDFEKLARASVKGGEIEEIRSVLKKIHPWSVLNYGMRPLDIIKKLYTETIPKFFGKEVEIQLLTPMLRGNLGTHNLNFELQSTLNPSREEVMQIQVGERVFRQGDRVIQRRNNYDLGVFNGDIGIVSKIDPVEFQCEVIFDYKLLARGNARPVIFEREQMMDLELAYAITIHKSQGSEFDVVIIPVATQHFKMLFRNLIYTGLTRAKRLAVFVGTRQALGMAVRNIDSRERQTALRYFWGPTRERGRESGGQSNKESVEDLP
jgi:exodeoxyribonuclease V alpha subunit